MSDETTGVNPPQGTSSSPEQQTIPKYRMDELIAEKRALEAQLQIQQQMLRQVAPPRQSQPLPEPEHMKALREENPNAYRTLKEQERKLRELSAANFSILDNQDRMAFLQEFGDEGTKVLPEIEQKLEELRSKGIHNYNRGQIMVHFEGVEAIKKRRAPKAPQQSQQQTPPPAKEALDAPGSDARSAGTVSQGSASVAKGSETLEEMETRLANEEF